MKKHIKLCLAFVLLMIGSIVKAQNIVQVEYFFDTDPGFENGVLLNMTPASTIDNYNFTPSTSGLSAGVHALFVRSKDANGSWSQTSSTIFLHTNSSSTKNITALEYFFDTDPGIGNGTQMALTPSHSIQDYTFSPTVSNLSTGVHLLFVRSKDENGNWSMSNSSALYFSKSSASTKVSEVEYFYDSDPGFGNGYIVSTSPSTNLSNISFIPNTNSLTAGIHVLNVRSKDENSSWSLTSSTVFFYSGAASGGGSSLPSMKALEYFYDTDPGIGLGFQVSLAGMGDNVSGFTFTPATCMLTIGYHNLFVRTLDSTNKWSLTAIKNFLYQGDPNAYVTPSVSIAATYTDICAGSNVTFTATPTNGGTAPIYKWKINNNVVDSGLTYSSNSLNDNDVVSCVMTANNICQSVPSAASNDITIHVHSRLNPALTITQSPLTAVCIGTPVQFSVSSVLAGGASPIYQWKKNNVNVGTNSSTYTDNALANGDVVKCLLTTSDVCALSNSATSNTLTAQIISPPSVSVGASSTTICAGQSTSLTASGNSNSYSWSPATGLSATTGASVTASPGTTTTYTVTGYNGCSVSKTISINVNAAPTASAGSDVSILEGSSTTLSATGGGTYLWSTGESTASINVAPVTTTTYTVTVANSNGCQSQDAVTVTVLHYSVSIYPSGSFDYGNAVTNLGATQNVTITNNGSASVTINSVSVSSPFSSSYSGSHTIAVGNHLDIPIAFIPTSTLFYQSTLTIGTSIGNYTIFLTGKGVSPAPAWTISSSLYDYGSVKVNNSSSYSVNINNTGNIPVSVGTITSNNTVFTASSSSSTIPVGQSVTLTATYTPTTITNYNGTVTIPTSTSGLSSLTLGLSGKGYVANTPPTLQLVSTSPYSSNTGVDPAVGIAGNYTYRVVYKSSANLAPQYGLVYICIDLNGDGDFSDAGEGIFSMNQVGTTSNWTSGETFTFTTTLPIGSRHQYKFFAFDANGNAAIGTNGFLSGPVVTNQTLDLSIYACDINFSITNPAVGQTFTTSATVHNNTPYTANNIVVGFYDNNDNYLGQATIATIAGNSSQTVSIPLSFSPDGFYPIKVWIDKSNTLNETNRLNNYAIRPITVGHFTVPGDIIVNATAYPSGCPSGATITGTANYVGLNLAGTPPVLGATVTVTISTPNGNITLSTYTITDGNWTVYTGLSCGLNYSYTVSVTDYTLTGNTSTKTFFVPCVICEPGGGPDSPPGGVGTCIDSLPDLYLVERFFTKVGPSTFSVPNANANCKPAGASVMKVFEATDNQYNFATATYLTSVDAPALDQYGSSTLTFSSPGLATGLHYLILITNANYPGGPQAIKESNYPNDTLRVEIAPDLYVSKLVVSNTNVHIGDQVNLVATVNNEGITASGQFHVQFVVNGTPLGAKALVSNINAGSSVQLLSAPYTITTNPTACPFTIKVITDVDNEVAEFNENNNLDTLIFGTDFTSGELCYGLGSPCNHYKVGIGGTLTMQSPVNNIGARDADAVHVQFKLGNTVIGTDTITHLTANSTNYVHVTKTFNSYGTYIIGVYPDYQNNYCEIDETNNVGYIYVDVVGLPDLRILSSDVSPSRLNPDPGDTITIVSSIHNIGDAISSPCLVKFMVNGVQLGDQVFINAIYPGQDTTVACTASYTNKIVGPKIIEVRVDSAHVQLEKDTTNNAATRAVIFGAAPDFASSLHEGITLSNMHFKAGNTIQISDYLRNYGGASGSAHLKFYCQTNSAKTLIKDTVFTLGSDDSARMTINWTATTTIGTIVTEITNSNPQEFNELNNIDSLAFVADTSLSVVVNTPAGNTCSNSRFTITASVISGNQSKTYQWYHNNVAVGASTNSYSDYVVNSASSTDSGYYSLSVTDASGTVYSNAVHVKVGNPTSSTTNITICSSSLPYSWNGTAYNAAGTYSKTLINSTGCDSVATLVLTVTTTVTPSVSIGATSSSICNGTSVTFTATPTNGGSSPVYQWKKNNVNVGTNSTTYTNAALVNGDNITCVMTANNTCQTSSTANGNHITMVVNGNVTPSVSIAANPVGAILAGTSVTFTATPINGGGSPSYQWKKNGNTVGTNSTTYTDATLVNGDVITCVLTANNSCQTAATATSNAITVSETATITWTGSVSSDWNVAANWNVHIVPSDNSNVSIPAVPRLPILTNDLNVNTLYLDGSLSINGHTLTINGAVIGNGTLKGSPTSSLIIAGTAGTLLFDANNNSLLNLTINGSATLGNTLNIYGTFTPTSGTFNTGDYLTLKSSNIDKTAVVGIVGATINGKVTVERHIPNGLRTYRDLGASGVANAGSIFDNWQESGVNTNGYGIYITGAQGVLGGYDAATGLDYSLTGNHSLFTYTNNTWDSVISTKGTALNPYQGYRVLVRGNRTGNLQTQLPFMWSNATVRAKGNLITGSVSFSTTGVSGNYPSSYKLTDGANNCSFIANPYTSIVDWEAVAAQSQNINQSYWYCDPTNTSDGTSSGYTVFVGYNALTHTSSNPLGTSRVNKFLQPGEAFFVENSSSNAPVVVFNELNKVPNQARMGIFGTSPVVNRIAVGLSKAGKNVDGAVSVFGTNFSKEIGAEDAIKFSNAVENIAFTLGGKDLCINGFTLPTAKDVLPIHLYNLTPNTSYSLRLDVSQFTGNGMAAYLKDNTTGTQTKLVGDSTVISFTTNAINAASFANRYGVVFQAATLPISNITAVATSLKGNQVLVKWSVLGEANVATYTVEHSVDGVNFNSLISLGSTTTNNYSFVDENAADGTNYYRIKATGLNGGQQYSNLIKLTTNHSVLRTIKVFPNPLVGSNLNLTLGNLDAGKYTVNIFNKLGQQVFEGVLLHIGSANPEQVNLGKRLAAGTYTLQVTSVNVGSYRTELEVK